MIKTTNGPSEKMFKGFENNSKEQNKTEVKGTKYVALLFNIRMDI